MKNKFLKLNATKSDMQRSKTTTKWYYLVGFIALTLFSQIFFSSILQKQEEATISNAVEPPKQIADLRLVRVTVYIDKGMMASGKFVYDGAAACPRSWKLGTKFELNGRTYTCEDRTAKWVETKFEYPTIDIWKDISYKDAIKEGVSYKVIEVLK